MTDEKEKEYEYDILWIGVRPSPMNDDLMKHIQTFHIIKDSKPELIDEEKFEKMVKEGKIRDSDSWRPKKEFHALVIKSYFTKFSTTIDEVRTCKRDFEDGWRACKKHMEE